MLLEKVSASTAAKSSEFGELRVLGSQSKRLERQRGRWSFLTWSFFLAQVMAADQFFGSAAKAAQDDDAIRAKPHSDSTSTTYDDSRDSPGSGVTSADDRVSDAASQTEAHAVGGGFGLPSNNAGHGNVPGASPSGSGASGSSTGASPSGSGASGSSSLGGPESTSGPAAQAGSDLNHDPGVVSTTNPSQVMGFDSSHNFPAVDIRLDLGFSQLPFQIHGSTETVSQALHTTLDQLTGLHLAETVGGLTALLGDAVDNTLNQITGLHLVGNAGELTALLGSALDNSLSVNFGATKALITQPAEIASSVGTLASSVTNLGLLGNIGDVPSNGTVSEVVHSALNQVAGMQLVDNAGGLGNTLNALLSKSTGALNTSDMGTPALNIVSELTSLGPNQDVSSGGTIAFPVLTSANIHQIDALFAGGQYTDYSLALHSDVNSGVTAIATTLSSDTNSTLGSLPLIDSPIHSHDSGSAPLQNVHDVGTSLVNHLI